MIIPIIIPFRPFCDDDDDDDKHHKGCECPDCKEKRKWENKPREYYEKRYAIPKRWRTKNTFFKILRLIPVILGVISLILSFIINNFALSVGLIFGGFVIAIVGFFLLDKFVKYDFECDDKIRLEKKRWFGETWEDIIKNSNIPDNYYLTKPEDDWRYK